jgi:outer membrane protein assembly factor BamB
MPRNPPKLLYVGIKYSVVAIETASGTEVWRTPLKGGSFVNVIKSGNRLYAANEGELFCLDPLSGGVLWHNPLKGLGRGVVTLVGPESAGADEQQILAVAEELRRREQQRQAAAAAV